MHKSSIFMACGYHVHKSLVVVDRVQDSKQNKTQRAYNSRGVSGRREGTLYVTGLRMVSKKKEGRDNSCALRLPTCVRKQKHQLRPPAATPLEKQGALSPAAHSGAPFFSIGQRKEKQPFVGSGLLEVRETSHCLRTHEPAALSTHGHRWTGVVVS